MRRVVISGLGAVSPLGHDVASTFDGLLEGRSGIVSISKFDASNIASQLAGEVRDRTRRAERLAQQKAEAAVILYRPQHS